MFQPRDCFLPVPQTWAIWATTWHLFVGALPFKLINDAATFVGPVFLNLLLGVVSAGQSSTLGYSYAALMFAGLLLGTLCDNQHFQRVMRAGARASAPGGLQPLLPTPGCLPCSNSEHGMSILTLVCMPSLGSSAGSVAAVTYQWVASGC